MTSIFTDYGYNSQPPVPHRDNRTPQQRTWDERAEAIRDIVARMRGLTHGAWDRDPAIIEVMTNLSRDLKRELHAMNIVGYRP
jgi:hypothetical protein